MKETIAAILLKTTKRRFLSLCASALLGLALLWLLNFIVNLSPDNKILKILEFLRILEVLKIILDKLSILIVSLPTAIFLWWFRTHDVGQGLKQSKDTYNQSDFFDGLDRLVSDEPLNIDLGVKKLIDFAEKDNSYNKDIRFAFIKRLKHLPKKYEEEAQKVLERNGKGNIPYLTYAQHILLWFKDKGIKIEDISNTRLDFQEFVLDVSGLDVYKQAENPLVYFLKQNNSSKNITFMYANLRNANLGGANLEGAKLLVTQLVGANLHGANLRGAQLEWANFLGANLGGANFLGAKLYGAKLPEGIMKYPREQ